MRSCIILTLLAVAAFGQNTSQTFVFKHTDAKGLAEIVNAIKVAGDINTDTQDSAQKSITVTGSQDQLSIAAWLSHELDQAPAPRPAPLRHDYPGNAGKDRAGEPEELHVFYVAHVDSPRELQEILNLTRSIADVQRFFPCVALNAIVELGTAQQTELAAWLLSELDQPAASMKPGHREHPFPADPRASLAQVYVLANTSTPQGVQEIVNGTRSLVDVQRCFPYNSRRVLTMRGTSDQIAFADWILGLLDRPASAPPDTAPHEYKYNTGWARDTATIARVFFLNVQNPQQLQQIVNEVRTATSILRAMPIVQPKAIAMRGTGDQISRAEQILKDK
jgi:hypothetical protein